MRPGRLAPLLSLLGVLGLGASGLGCSPQSYLAIMPGVVNNPDNYTLRRELLAFGTGSLCKELLQRSVPLKINADDPTLGRFYAKQCNVETLQNNGDLYVQFGGSGYAWTNLTKRIGFNASAAVQYAQDFRLDGSTMYVYFKPAAVTAKKFEQIMVEGGQLPDTPVNLLLPGGTAQGFVNQVGEGMLNYELGRGFTVIRDSDGEVTFSVGYVAPGEKPLAPYEERGGRFLYLNERVEVHQNQRDYAGPFTVESSGQALYVTALVEGAAGVDLLVVPRASGDVWIQQYLTTPQAGAAPAPALHDEPVAAVVSLPGAIPGAPTAPAQPFRRKIKLPKGAYYVVIDNTSTAGRTQPGGALLDDRAAMVSLAVELGDD